MRSTSNMTQNSAMGFEFDTTKHYCHRTVVQCIFSPLQLDWTKKIKSSIRNINMMQVVFTLANLKVTTMNDVQTLDRSKLVS